MASLRKKKAGIKFVQSALYDDKILCAECDGKIGELDKYAVEFCRRFKSSQHPIYPYFSIKNVDTNTLIRFAASVIWRCSISALPQTDTVDIGTEIGAFRDVIFNEPIVPITYPQVALMRYTSKILDDVEHFCSVPAITEVRRAPNEAIFYAISIGGFRIVVKIDRGVWPQNLPPIPINGYNNASGIFVDLDRSTEFKTMAELLKKEGAHIGKRRKIKQVRY